MRVSAAALLVLGGCQLVLGIESATLDTTPDAAVADAATLVTVTGGRRDRWAGGQVDEAWEIEPTLYYEEGGGFVTRTGTYGDHVRFTIPEGDYFVRLDPASPWSPLALSASPTIDLSEWAFGRGGGGEEAALGTHLILQASGLTPGWKAGDELFVSSITVGTQFALFPNSWDPARIFSAAPIDGSTSLSVEVDWKDWRTPSGAKSDVLHLLAYERRPVGTEDARVLNAIAALELPPTLPGGTTSTVSGVFVAPATRTAQADFRRSQFAALRAQVHPSAVTGMRALAFRVQPVEMGGRNSSMWSSPNLFWYDRGEDTDVNLGTLTFGNPFPSALIVVRDVQIGFFVEMMFGGQSRHVDAFAQTIADADSASPIVEPAIGPVRFPTVNGRGAFADGTDIGPHPVLTWMPPSLGTPNRYIVRVLRYTSADQHDQIDLYVPGRVTRLKIPPDVLRDDAWHVFVIEAVLAGGDAEREPFLTRLPYASAPIISGKFAVGPAPF